MEISAEKTKLMTNNSNGMIKTEIRAEKTKLMTNTTSGINTEIKVNGQKLETVTSFKYCLLYTSDACLLYTSPSPRDSGISRMPSSA